MDAPESWEHALRDETRAIYVEAITNPTMRVVDLEAVADFAHRQGLVAMIDATFATPLNLRPVELGFDLVLHSATKYLNGHSDLVAGAIAGRAELVERIGTHLRRLGGTLDPHGCFLLHRGLKTLAPRVAWQNASALALARFLADHDAVARVSYPGLSGHPDHQRARRLFDGFGGMLAFELADSAPGAADRFLDGLELCVVAPSLGGVETLVTVPARSSHASLAPEERRALGVGDALIRVSVGVEDVEDLEADIARALDAA
jgi:cystathionine beta-lyase/cystathionine gamma-synthase